MRKIEEFEKTNMEPTFEEALDVCIKYFWLTKPTAH